MLYRPSLKNPKFDYSISEPDVDQFVKAYPIVQEFLNKYEKDGLTYYEKSTGLARFFRFLQVKKQIKITPTEFLNRHLQMRNSQDIEERRWALKLALEYSRDNPDLKGKAKNYQYTAWFLPIKGFCDYNEAPLTATNGHFPKRNRRKHPDKPFTVDFIKRVLAVLNERDKAICMTELQSGQAIKQVLVDINAQAKRIFREIDQGAGRIRFDFPERKGNGFPYFSYISYDAIQQIQKWRPIRDHILDNLGIKSDYLFITEAGRILHRKHFHTNMRNVLINHGLYTGPLSCRNHGFRKFFEQEASPPDRGISKAYITFMMGHSEGKDSNGIRVTHPLDAVGGVYDNSPRTYPEVVEKEYQKLEPYINIYTGKGAGSNSLHVSPKHEEILKALLDDLETGKAKIVYNKKA